MTPDANKTANQTRATSWHLLASILTRSFGVFLSVFSPSRMARTDAYKRCRWAQFVGFLGL